MDGNSTMSLGQSLSGYSEIFLSFILVILTGVLAYYTKNLFHATSKYVDLVGSQNQIMDEQNKMMDENRKHELLVKKYNRMVDEMNNFVAYLYARRKDPQIFTQKKFSSKIKYKYNGDAICVDSIHRDFFDFWEHIYKNIYLNRSNGLQKCIDDYFKSINNIEYLYHHAGEDFDVQLEKATREFRVIRRKLIHEIEYRYGELTKQISDIESELGISVLSQQESDSSHEDI